jgi:hypothetical protein
MYQRTFGQEERRMRDAALLVVWLVGLFSLIGGVMAAVARVVRQDAEPSDDHLAWAAMESAGDARREGTSEISREEGKGVEEAKADEQGD